MRRRRARRQEEEEEDKRQGEKKPCFPPGREHWPLTPMYAVKFAGRLQYPLFRGRGLGFQNLSCEVEFATLLRPLSAFGTFQNGGSGSVLRQRSHRLPVDHFTSIKS